MGFGDRGFHEMSWSFTFTARFPRVIHCRWFPPAFGPGPSLLVVLCGQVKRIELLSPFLEFNAKHY
jgi:hypothetical protein